MRRGFTLIEMVAVLFVLALTTHLAVRSCAHLLDAKRTQAADRQLETLRRAVYDPETATGFLADTGRLVMPTNGTLAELWIRPPAMRPYGVRPATRANLVPAVQALEDSSVYVPTGWRGPYLRLPLGQRELLDPWGNPIVTRDAAGFERVTVTNGCAVAASHYGAAALERDRRAGSLLPEGGAESRLVVRLVSAAETPPGEVEYRWYGPADGLITGAVQTVVYPAAAVFDGLAPGERIVWDSVSRVPRRCLVRPGDNLVQIDVK